MIRPVYGSELIKKPIKSLQEKIFTARYLYNQFVSSHYNIQIHRNNVEHVIDEPWYNGFIPAFHDHMFFSRKDSPNYLLSFCLWLSLRRRLLWRRHNDSSEPSLQCFTPSQTLSRATHWFPDAHEYFPAVNQIKTLYNFKVYNCVLIHICQQYLCISIHIPLWQMHSAYSSDPSEQSFVPSQYLFNIQNGKSF